MYVAHIITRTHIRMHASYPPSIPMEPPGSTPHGGLRRQAMLSFKQFLTQQDDSIDESEATAKYNEYKIDFKRTVIKEFFDEHKDEDW